MAAINNISENLVPGAVILYNPGRQVLDNIHSYLHDVERLYALDNSDKKDLALLNEIRHA
jgi:rhamnosyltransferase